MILSLQLATTTQGERPCARGEEKRSLYNNIMSKEEDFSGIFGESEEEDNGEQGSEDEYEEEEEYEEEYEEGTTTPAAKEDPEKYKERLDAAKQNLRNKYP